MYFTLFDTTDGRHNERTRWGFRDGKIIPYGYNGMADGIYFSDNINSISEAATKHPRKLYTQYPCLSLNEKSTPPYNENDVNSLRFMELVHPHSEEAQDPLLLSGTIRLYGIKLTHDPIDKQMVDDLFKKETTSWHKPSRQSLKFLSRYKPEAILLDEVTLSFDHREFDLKVTLTSRDGQVQELRRREAYAFAVLFDTSQWTLYSDSDRYNAKRNQYFSSVADILDGTKSFKRVIGFLYNSPSVRQCWRECGNLVPLMGMTVDKCTGDDGLSPAKLLGVSKVSFKIIMNIYNNVKMEEWRKRPVIKNLSNAAKKLSEAYNDQIAENFLSSISTAVLRDVPTETRAEAELVTSNNLAILERACTLANFVIDHGGPKGKNYDVDRLLEYLLHDIDVYQGISKVSEGISLLQDYYRSYTVMDVKIKDLFPRSLKLAHDVAARNVRVNKDEFLKRSFTKAVSEPKYRNLSYKDEEYSVLTPSCPMDVQQEGLMQHHCVGSYVRDIANQKTCICFMRRTEDTNTPVLTLEVNPTTNELIQYRGASNRAPTKDEMKWLKKWCKEKHLDIR